MLIPDLTLLTAVLALAAWRLFAPGWRQRWRILSAGVVLLLAGAQYLLCGFTWQFLPAYFLLALSAPPPLLRTGPILRGIGRLGFVGIAGACVCVWVFPAVPTLPRPDGPYAVGSHIHRWTDASRDEPHTADPVDRRDVIVQAWYPLTSGAPHVEPSRFVYIDGLGRLPPTVSGIPSFLLHRYGQIETHAETFAPLAAGDRAWPVVIFSPGYGAPRAVYTGLVTQLASRGFVVLVLDHPYESAVTELPDGRVVGTREILLPGESNRLPYMTREQERRASDVRFVIDQLARPNALSLQGGTMDGSKVAVIGHSFGGAAAIAAMSEDPRIVAAADIDGTPYGDLPDRVLTKPFLLLQSDHAETGHSSFFFDGNNKLLVNATVSGFRYEIRRANHYSFTDAPYFLAPPGRWLLAQAMGGSLGPEATQRATADILTAFLSGPLRGTPADMDAVVARHLAVHGGEVERKTGSAPSPDVTR